VLSQALFWQIEMNETIEIRGQEAGDWKDLYAIRTATPGALPYIRPDWVREELAEPKKGTWPLVAVAHLADGPRVMARTNLQLGSGRREHCATLTLEQHPDLAGDAGRKLLCETVEVAEKWWNKRRLDVTLPAADSAAAALFGSLGFVQEARLRESVRVAGELVDEVILARLSGAAAASRSVEPGGRHSQSSPRSTPDVRIRGGSSDDWEAYHAIWSQPDVCWGTMQIPYPSADWNRERVRERTPPRFWPLVAEVDGRVVGNAGMRRDEHHRSHVGHAGMMVHSDYWGMGIGSALMAAVIDLAENWIGLTRIQLEVYTDNGRAIRLYEKNGFNTEGVCRAFSFRDGQYVDALLMARLCRVR